MTKKATTAPSTTPKPVQKAAPAATKYRAADLKEHSRELFGVKTYVFAGAFYGKEQSSVTKEEAQKIIDNYLKGKGGKR